MADKSDNAQGRTEWAEDRTIMANERTWAAKAVATIFLIIAILIFWSARRQACKTLVRLQENDVEATPTRGFTLLAGVMTIAAIGTGTILWML